MKIVNGVMTTSYSLRPNLRSNQSQTLPRVTNINTRLPMDYNDEDDEDTLQTEASKMLHGQMHHLMDRITDDQKQVLLELANLIVSLDPSDQNEYLQWGQFVYGGEHS